MISNQPNPVPLQCVWETTLSCNLRCRHCGSSAGKPRRDELTTAEATAMFAQLADLGCRKLTLSGGEPTMRADFLELVAAAKAAGLRVSAITNAVFWTLPLAQSAKAAGLESVGLSVDGLGVTHDQIRGRSGHFATLLEAMRVNVSIGLPWAAVTFINNYNLELLPQMYSVLAERGAFAWQVQLGTDMGNMRHNRDLLLEPRKLPRLDEILTALVRRKPVRVDVSDSIGYYGPHEAQLRSSALRHRRKRTFGGCGAGTRVIGIESNGNVKGCLSIMAGYNEEANLHVEGNLRQHSLAEIWTRDGAFAFNRQFHLDQLSGFCRQCPHAMACRGGCYGKRVGFGDPSDNPLCLYRVLCETAQSKGRVGQAAAAALLASTLAGGVTGCHNADEPGPLPTDTSTDTQSDDPIETDYSASWVDTTVTDSGTAATVNNTADYSDPSTDYPDYGDPWTDESSLDYSNPWTDDPASASGVDTNTGSDSDTDGPLPILAKQPVPEKRQK